MHCSFLWFVSLKVALVVVALFFQEIFFAVLVSSVFLTTVLAKLAGALPAHEHHKAFGAQIMHWATKERCSEISEQPFRHIANT